MTAPHQPRTNLGDIAPCSMCGDAVSCLDTEEVAVDRELFAVECECGVRGPFCKTPVGAVTNWNRMHMQTRTCCAQQDDCPAQQRTPVVIALTHMNDAIGAIWLELDDIAGGWAEEASRVLGMHEQLDALRDACDKASTECDNTEIGWQGRAEQAATDAITALEAWLEENK